MGCCGRRIKAAAKPSPASLQVKANAASEKPLTREQLRRLGSTKTE